MPKRIVNDLVILYREGKQIVPEVGKEFDFTAEELNSVTKSNPKALSKIGGDLPVLSGNEPVNDLAPTAEKSKGK